MKLSNLLYLWMAGMILAGTAQAQDLKSLQGKVEIDGSSTVAPISMEAADMFSDICPKVDVPVGVSGTGGGFKRFTKGDTDISDASRPIKASEMQQCKDNNIEFIELPVAYDGLTIAVNKQNNWVNELTVDQLKRIFRDDMKARTWKDVNAAWPNKEIKIFAPGTDSGTFDYFKEVVVGKDEASIRDDMSVSEDDNQLVLGIANTKDAIGFFGAAYYFENMDKLKAVKIVNPKTNQAVSPSPAAIESGEYAPFSRPLFIYVNAKAAKRPEVKVFVNHYLNHAAEMAEDVGYVGLPEDIYESAQEHFKNGWTGTHFLDSAGEKVSGSLVDLYKKETLVK